MAFAIRNVLRQNDLSNAVIEDQNLENRQALIREEEARQRRDREDSVETEAEQLARELDMKRKNEEAEAKRQLQVKKREKIKVMSKKLKINDTFAVVFAGLGTVVAFFEVEDNYSNEGKDRNTSSTNGTYMRSFVLVASLLLAVCSVRHYILNYHIARERQTTSTGVGSSFARSKYFCYMLGEVFYVLIHCPPGLDMEIKFEQLDGKLTLSADAVLTTIMLLRIFLLARVVKHYSRWANEHSRGICEELGCNAGSFFVMKALFKEKPYMMIGIVMSLSIVIFGLATRSFERPYNSDNVANIKHQDYDYVWNAMWLIVLTMTTVGYGDFFPQTHMGRFVVIIACFWGVFIVSIMVVTLNETSKFTKSESKAFDILERLKAKDQCVNAAGKAVLNFLRLNVLKQKVKAKNHEDLRLIYLNRMQEALTAYKLYKRQWKGFDLPDEERLRQLTDKLDADLDELRTQVGYMLEIDEQMALVEEFQERSLQTVNYSIRHLEDLISQTDKHDD